MNEVSIEPIRSYPVSFRSIRENALRSFLLVFISIGAAVIAHPVFAASSEKLNESLHGGSKPLLTIQDLTSGSLPGVDAADDKILKEAPRKLVDRAVEELRKGSLQTATRFGVRLAAALESDPEAAALAAIALYAQGRITEADKLMGNSSQISVSLPVLCARAMKERAHGDIAKALEIAKQAQQQDPSHPYPWNIIGRCHNEMGNSQEAQACFAKTVQLEPGFGVGYCNLGALALASNDLEAAAKNFSTALKIDPSNSTALVGIAMVQEATNQLEAALGSFKRAVAVSPGLAVALSSIGRLEIQLGQYKDALVTGKKLVDTGDAAGWLIVADALLHGGQTDHALKTLQYAPADLPAKDFLHGFCLVAREDYAGARDKMQEVINKAPDHFGAAFAQAVLQIKLGQKTDLAALTSRFGTNFAESIAFLRGVSESSQSRWPQSHEALKQSAGLVPGWTVDGIDVPTSENGISGSLAGDFGLGVMCYIRGLTIPADVCFGRVITGNPRSPLGQYWMGVNSLKRADRARALGCFEKATELAPRFFAALFAAGELSFTSGQTAKAAEYYGRAHAVRPDAGLALRLGVYFENNKQPEKAEKYLREAVALAPNFFAVYNQLAWHFAKQGKNLDEALELARKADKLQPANASVLDTIGWIFFLKKDLAGAEKHLHLAVEANSSNPSIWYHLGTVQNAAGKVSEARATLKRSLEISSTFDGAEEARSLLQRLESTGRNS